MPSVYVIAEAGVNHNGSLTLAKELIDVAVQAGADAVKFQTFTADNLVTRSAVKAPYQVGNTDQDESQYDMLKRLELSEDAHFELLDYCEKKSIRFLSSAFDGESLKFLHQALQLSTLKIGSGEMTNGPLLLAHAQTNCDLIISTGMASLGEVEVMLGVIAFGYVANAMETKLDSEVFAIAYRSSEGQSLLQKKVVLLHCSSEYPAPLADVNLTAMQTLAQAFRLKVGYSDHTQGIAVSIAAAALGASVIEKHFTLDKTLPGPDHKASLEPNELAEMITAIRMIEVALGDGVKKPSASEWVNRDAARKSLIAAQDIKVGDTFSADNILVKRPGHGVSPMQYWSLLGKKATTRIKAGELIRGLMDE